MKLNLRSVDLNLLPVFAAVVEDGQLSRAAERLGMSQPAVSAALQRLRLTVGDPLFTRSRTGLSPTPRAQALYQQVSGSLRGIAEALDPGSRFDPATARRTFRLVAVDYFETLMFGSLVADLRSEGAGLVLQMQGQQGDWQRRLLQAEVDIAFDHRLPEDNRLAGRVVGEERLAVVARVDHPRIHGSLALEDFLAEEHVVLPEKERRTLPLDQILGRPGWQRRIGAHVMQFGSLLAVAGATDLIATVPLRLAHALAHEFGLQILPFPVEVAPVSIYMIWPAALGKDQAHAWFRDFLLRRLPYGQTGLEAGP